jgi:predicted glycosyltransferase
MRTVTSEITNTDPIVAVPAHGAGAANVHRSGNNCRDEAQSTAGIRVALYSHDTMGLGHLRRNLLVADALARPPLYASNLLITGAMEANFFRLPERADCLTLPRMHKDAAGDYTCGNLQLSLNELAELRGNSICSALAVFQPDLLIVDKVPAGAVDEMLPALQMLSQRGHARCVLGIRDVLDDPATVAREWLNAANRQIIEAFFDAIWIYGDRRVYDPIVEYHLPDTIASRIRFTGYLDQSVRLQSPSGASQKLLDRLNGHGRLIACMVGGGQDGYDVAKTFIRALPRSGVTGVVLTGPFMPFAHRAALRQLAASIPNVHIVDFIPEADVIIQRAERIVSMAGYNTVCSVLSFGKKSLLVPRVSPRSEQKIRAERLAKVGLVDVMLPQNLSVADMRRWMTEDDPHRPSPHEALDFGGVGRLVSLAHDVLGSSIAAHTSRSALGH